MEHSLFVDLLDNLIYAEIIYHSYQECTHTDIMHELLYGTHFELSHLEALKKYIKDFEEFKNFMKMDSKEQFEYLTGKIKPQLQEKYRYDLLFYILKYELENMREMDLFAYNNLEALSALLEKYFTNPQNQEELDYDLLVTLSINDSINLCISYFDFLDSTHQLSNIFKQEIKDGRICMWNIKKDEIPSIIYKQVSENFYYDWCVSFDTELVLNAPYEENILDTYCLIHEFMHFLTKRNQKELFFSDNFYGEIPSVFHERFAGYFFREAFSSLKNLESIYQYRNEAESKGMEFYQLLLSMKKQEISSGDDLRLFLEANYQNPVELCDILSANSIMNDRGYHELYRYPISILISDQLIDKILHGNPHILKKIMNLPNYLNENPTPLQVLDMLECSSFFENWNLNQKPQKLIQELKF